MPQATYHFPRGFLWGTATAAHQVEGNNTNNQWWKWEQEGHTNGKSGLACDWWGGRWREDFDRAAEGRQNAHRLSVEWSRIQPTPDTWDEDALERVGVVARPERMEVAQRAVVDAAAAAGAEHRHHVRQTPPGQRQQLGRLVRPAQGHDLNPPARQSRFDGLQTQEQPRHCRSASRD